ncbi:MAG: ABC transporter permease [Chthoniobacteraceae bacterium]
MSRFLDNLWVQNFLVIGGFLLVAFLLWSGSHNENWRRAGQRLRKDRVGLIALGVVCLYLFIGALEMIQIPSATGQRSILSAMTQHIPREKSYSAPFAKKTMEAVNPSPLNGTHILGTDALGNDTFVQVLKACRTALIIGGLTSAIYIPLGTLLGILAGYYRKRVDDAIQYIYTTVASIPEILLLVALLMVMKKSLGSMAIALGVTAWVGLCRLIRGETLRQAERPYVAAARALGQSNWKIIMHHVLPNVMHLVFIKFVLGFSGLVLAEAVLSYLGVGSPVGTPSWGAMIDGARSELSREPVVWWNIGGATVALFFLVLSLNVFGDSLRRAFDPKRG